MFSVRERNLSAHSTRFGHALKQLPEADRGGQRAALGHMQDQLGQAAEDAGLSAQGVGVHFHEGQGHVGIAFNQEGDQLADKEFGTPSEGPDPILRTRAHQAHHETSRLYAEHLWRGIGI